MSAVLTAACEPTPEVRYRSENLEIAPAFAHPVCRGTVAQLQEHFDQVHGLLARPPRSPKVLVYWFDEAPQEYCRSALGCFYPGTRIVFARGQALFHEIVHAAQDVAPRSHFFHEGLAEVLGGVGLQYRAKEPGRAVRENLAVGSRGYRHGRLDYRVAAHFVHFVHEQVGPAGLRDLAVELERGGDSEAIMDVIANGLERDFDQVLSDYEEASGQRYPSLLAAELTEVAPGPARSLVRELDCTAESTYGPLWNDESGMYRVESLVLSEPLRVAAKVVSNGDAFVVVLDAWAQDGGKLVDWRRPHPDFDGGRFELEAGGSKVLALAPGRYLLVFASREPEVPITVELQFSELAAPSGSADELRSPEP